MAQHCTVTGMISKILVTVGAINWGLVGLAALLEQGNWNVVNLLLGQWPTVENVVYLLVGLAGLLCLHCLVKMCTGSCEK